MQFSKLVIAAFLALASSVTAAPIAAGGDLIEARTGTDQTAIQAIGNIAQFQHDTNKGFVAVQVSPQVAASLLNAGFITQVSHKRSDQDALQAIGNIAQFQHDTNIGFGGATQLDPQVAASLLNFGAIKQVSHKRSDQDALQAIGNIAQFQHDTNIGAFATQADPQTAVSAGNVGVISQFKGFWPRATTQTAGQSVGNIAQFQHDTNNGGWVAVQADPQAAISAGNTGILKQFHWARGGDTQNAAQAVGNIAQFQHDTNKGFVAIQEDPQVAISAGNTGILKQFHWARDTTQNAGQSVGNIVQSQSNSNSGGLVAIQVDPQVALSLGNLGLLGQSSSGGGSTTQNAGQAVGNIAQTQHNTNKGGLVGIQADPQIGISAGNAGALAQKIKW